MEYRQLGTAGIKVSPLCLGTMMFGDRTDAAEAGRIVASAYEAGINFIDTADQYAAGESERVTGNSWPRAATTGCSRPKSATRWGLGRMTSV